MKFQFGILVQTAAIAKLEDHKDVLKAFSRFAACDWGDLPEEDKRLNDEAVNNGGRIIGRYSIKAGDIYIITEENRAYTTIMFVSEY